MTNQTELCIALKDHYKNPLSFLPIIHELYIETKDNVFIMWIESYCMENNLCPRCYEALEIKKIEEKHTEVNVFNTEYIYYGVCNTCGWSEEK